MESVCSSSDLDQLLEQKELKISFQVPKNIGVDFVSERTTEMSMTSQQVLVSQLACEVEKALKCL